MQWKIVTASKPGQEWQKNPWNDSLLVKKYYAFFALKVSVFLWFYVMHTEGKHRSVFPCDWQKATNLSFSLWSLINVTCTALIVLDLFEFKKRYLIFFFFGTLWTKKRFFFPIKWSFSSSFVAEVEDFVTTGLKEYPIREGTMIPAASLGYWILVIFACLSWGNFLKFLSQLQLKSNMQF